MINLILFCVNRSIDIRYSWTYRHVYVWILDIKHCSYELGHHYTLVNKETHQTENNEDWVEETSDFRQNLENIVDLYDVVFSLIAQIESAMTQQYECVFGYVCFSTVVWIEIFQVVGPETYFSCEVQFFITNWQKLSRKILEHYVLTVITFNFHETSAKFLNFQT